jgi:hypothetical protein
LPIGQWVEHAGRPVPRKIQVSSFTDLLAAWLPVYAKPVSARSLRFKLITVNVLTPFLWLCSANYNRRRGRTCLLCGIDLTTPITSSCAQPGCKSLMHTLSLQLTRPGNFLAVPPVRRNSFQAVPVNKSSQYRGVLFVLLACRPAGNVPGQVTTARADDSNAEVKRKEG